MDLCFLRLTALFNHQIVAMFIDRSYPAYDIAVAGLPLFASGFIFFVCKHCFHWLFPKCRAGTSGYDDYSFCVGCFYGTLFIWLAVAIEGARDMAGSSFGGNTTFLVIMAIYYRKHQWVRR